MIRLVLLSVAVSLLSAITAPANADERPNFIFAIADDWGWPHAGVYGDPVVKTPTFDQLAEEGILFHHAYVSSPSCTPSRGAILTGQWHWRLGWAGNLWSEFPDDIAVYPEHLAKAGYQTGGSGKTWGPGRTATKGRSLAGKKYKSFEQFFAQRDAEKPFCYWLGSSDPHRPYALGSGKKSGMDLDAIKLFPCFPDSETVRSDVADYYFEVQRFDALVGRAVATLKAAGELENTVIFMTGDHGMPFPRCKSNNYDSGARIPLAVRWGAKIKGGREVEDFVSMVDIGPTIMHLAGLKLPTEMTGRSLQPIFASDASGIVTDNRNFVLHGKERHVPGQEENLGGYPSRAIRTHDFLYIRNFEPQRWPAGTPDHTKAAFKNVWLADCDGGPTKRYMVEHKDDNDQLKKLYDLSFGKRPAEELYDLKADPDQMNNVAGDPKYKAKLSELSGKLMGELKATSDPRVVGGGEKFDEYPYLGGGPKFPGKR